MLNILLTAGNDTKKLASYIEQQRAIRVSEQIESLGDSHQSLANTLVDVDKLIYVLKEGMSYRKDMGVLKRNLQENNFFTVREILFICCEGYDNSDPLKYFNEVMAVTNFEKYKVVTVQDLSFAEIYDVIIGTKDSNKFTPNKRETIYRREKNSLGNTAYVEDSEVLSEKDFFTMITPESTSAIDNNIKLKGIIAQSESGNLIEDAYEDRGIEIENISLPIIDLPKGLSKNIILISGGRKTGVTTLCHLLSNSALDGEIKSIVIDATNTGDNELLADKYYSYSNVIKFKSFVLSPEVSASLCYNLMSIDNTTKLGILDRLTYIINNMRKLKTDILFIECRLEMLESISNIISDRLQSIIYCCDMSESGVKEIASKYINIEGVENTILLSNNIEKYSEDYSSDVHSVFQSNSITGADIKELFNELGIVCSLRKLPRVTALENDFKLYEAISGNGR